MGRLLPTSIQREELLDENDYVDASLDVAEMLELQRITMEEQNRGLDGLSQAVARQRDIGQAIFEEVDQQNVLLDELDDHLDAINSRTNAATPPVGDILPSRSDKIQCGLIVLLLPAVLVVALLVTIV